jgi:uncharacterized membrane protein
MNSALTAEGPRRLGHAQPRLKPDFSPSFDDAAKAAPFQNSTPASSTFRWTWWTLVPLTLAAAVVAAPFLLTHGFPAIGMALYRGFAIVCHQRPERSLWISGAAVAVCSRCLGIYLGAAAFLLFRTSRSIALRILLVAAALNLFDVVTEWAGLHGNWLAVRFACGLALGAAAALLISSSAVSAVEVVAECRPIASWLVTQDGDASTFRLHKKIHYR